jgi:ElaB/YqjD/DUF883 family membrane-anchored ribosome-binding protein
LPWVAALHELRLHADEGSGPRRRINMSPVDATVFHHFIQGAAMENSHPESWTSASAQPNQSVEEKEANASELARQAARQAIESGKEYAQNAVNAAGKKLTAAKEQMGRAADQGSQYVSEQPGRAVAIAAAGGAILGALLATAMRGRR